MSDLRRIIWLASFPKSGNTWVRSFLARYFQPPGQEIGINELHKFTTADVRQDFFDKAAGGTYRATRIEDWLAMRPRALGLIAGSKPGHHFVKTHCQAIRLAGTDLIPPALTAAAIYVIRNPFDVAPSYARHQSIGLDEAIERMLNARATHSTGTGIMEVTGRWDDNVTSWTGATGLVLHVMRYEDMVANAERAFKKLFGFLKIRIDDMQFRRALGATSFTAMQRQEAREGFRERPDQMAQFFARGRDGGWREDLSPAQVARLREAFLPVLERWYPELLDETATMAQAR